MIDSNEAVSGNYGNGSVNQQQRGIGVGPVPKVNWLPVVFHAASLRRVCRVGKERIERGE